MEPTEPSSTLKHMPERTSLCSHKRHGSSSASTSSHVSTADDESAKSTFTQEGVPISDASPSSASPLCRQLSLSLDTTSAPTARTSDTHGAEPSTTEASTVLSSAPDITQPVQARSSDAVATVCSAIGASVQLSPTPQTMPATKLCVEPHRAMEPTVPSSTLKHKPKKKSRRFHKRHGSSTATMSTRVPTANEKSDKSTGVPISDKPPSSASPLCGQLSPALDTTSALTARTSDADAAQLSTTEASTVLSSARDITPTVHARSSDAVAAICSASGASIKLSLTPQMTPATKPSSPVPVAIAGIFQSTSEVSGEDSKIVGETVKAESPLPAQLPDVHKDTHQPSENDLELRQPRRSVQIIGPDTIEHHIDENTKAPGEEQKPDRLIRSRLSDITLPMSGAEGSSRGGQQEPVVAKPELMRKRSSTARHFRYMGRSIRSSISSAAMSPSSWASSTSLARRFPTHEYERLHLNELTVDERPGTASRELEDMYYKAVLGVIIQAVIAIVVVTALVAVFKMLILAQPKPNVCRSYSCLEYSERLRRSINLSINPCDSLDRFVCSGWNFHNVLSMRIIFLETTLARLSRLTLSVGHFASGQQSAEQRGAALFRSCDAVLWGERDELRSVRSALDEADVSWPGRTSTQRPPDTLRTLLFSALHLGWAAILRIDIRGDSPASLDGPAPRKRETHSVQLAPSREFRMLARKYASQLTWPDARKAYVGLLAEELGTGWDKSSVLALDTAQRLDADFLAPLATTLKEKRHRPTGAVEDSRLFSGLRVLENRWRDTLTEYGLSPGFRLLLRAEHGHFVRTFLHLWESNGEARTHLFVSWCTTQVAALFASRRLVVSFYECDQHGPIMQGLHCLAHAYLLSGFSLFARYNAELFRGDTRAHAGALVNSVREQFRKALMDEAENAKTVDEWTSMDIIFKAVDHMTYWTGDDGGEARPDYPAMGDSLVDNWRRVADAQPEAASTREEAAVSSAIESLALYAFVEHNFLLLPYAFSFPLYDEDAARAISYAGLGNQVALALSELWMESHRERLPRTLKCVFTNSTKFEQVETQALQVLSAEVVFDAYRSTAETSDERLVGFQSLTLPQLFFVAACYAMCPGVPSPARFIAGLTDDINGAEPGCDAVLGRTKQFAQAFGCKAKATKNAGAQCSVLARS